MPHALDGQVSNAISQRLQAVASELGFSARLGGDEFALVFARAMSVEEIREAGERLVRLFHPPLTVDSADLAMSVSVGASVFPEHGRSPEALLRAADAALFLAKTPGCSQLNMYSPDLLEAAAAKFAVEQDLRRALEEGEFELVNQPEPGRLRREVEIVEPLIRWREPGGRLASADEFLTVEEESGLIMDINDWALHSAIATSARWHFARTLASLLMVHRDS
jgi:predicted signal transduction protein with EAL and GGDEF domain